MLLAATQRKASAHCRMVRLNSSNTSNCSGDSFNSPHRLAKKSGSWVLSLVSLLHACSCVIQQGLCQTSTPASSLCLCEKFWNVSSYAVADTACGIEFFLFGPWLTACRQIWRRVKSSTKALEAVSPAFKATEIGVAEHTCCCLCCRMSVPRGCLLLLLSSLAHCRASWGVLVCCWVSTWDGKVWLELFGWEEDRQASLTNQPATSVT